MAVLPKKTLPQHPRHRARAVYPVAPKKPVEPPPADAVEWDTRGMIRALSAKYPNLDPSLLGWTLLACRVQLASDESRANILAVAEQLIRTDLFDGAARRQRRTHH